MKALFISAHTDDAELGCGGTIAKLLEDGSSIKAISFCHCGREDLKEEFVKSMDSLLTYDRILLNYDVRNFDKNRQSILDNLIEIKNEFKPDAVFVHCANDIHQDHKVVYEEALRAFKDCTIYGYELPWNNLSFNSTAFFKLKERHIDKKAEALSKYKSQAHRNYMDKDFHYSLAKVRGVQIGVEYAEAFELIRLIND